MVLKGIYDVEIETFLNMGASYRLAVTKESYVQDDRALNVGERLSLAIDQTPRLYNQSTAKFQLTVASVLEEIIKKHIFIDDKYGSTIILMNVGILFEQELHIDVVGLLKRISKNTLTVLLWPGEMDEAGLYFLEKGSKYTINLNFPYIGKDFKNIQQGPLA